MIKRLFDIVFSIIGLLLSLPVFVVISILIKLCSPGPVFFIQQRIGKYFKPFMLYKFRSMVVDAPNRGLAITTGGDPRITKIGRFIRRTKLDEMPQLINVLKGDMSIVGPRPEVEKYVEMFKDEYKEILQVKPGITNCETIKFINEEEILGRYSNPEDGYIREILPAKIELYKRYLKNKGFFNDTWLILLTVWKIVKIS
ncbi:MAG TPA: sugar transferase [Candidatus Wunengus sp. YC61]|uniref:sugar transferase n=1 Tax=Candidatus Wunengus sp. YC61 TaxID=3367698 RepID=UPI0040273985